MDSVTGLAALQQIPHEERPRALVVGATGFIGRGLVGALHRKGWDVHGMSGKRASVADIERIVGPGSIHSYTGKRSEIDEALARARPSVVFHVASRSVNQHRPQDIATLLDANVALGTELADAMVAAGVHRLVVAASHWQHFGGAEYSPVNLYAATKQALQTILRFYTESTQLRVRIVTVYETYGPNDARGKLIDLLCHAARTGMPLDMSPGAQLLDVLHVSDVAAAFLAAARTFESSDAPELEFAATSGRLISVRDLVAVMESAVERRIPVSWGALSYGVRKVMFPWRGPVAPGWEPIVKLEDGLRETFYASERSDVPT